MRIDLSKSPIPLNLIRNFKTFAQFKRCFQKGQIMRKGILVIIASFISGIGGAFFFHNYLERNQEITEVEQVSDYGNFASTSSSRTTIDASVDFVDASAISTPSVVYIKTLSETRGGNSFYDLFFGGRVGQTVSSGSGVIYTNNGYIITNFHVIENSDEIKVIINKDEYSAKVVGTDPNTDLAVLKVDQENLPNIAIGSSKDVKVGEWVLAVGNPFNLTSTVTAGIVSAKGREINILKSRFPIESFIQTDAAINPGNSGGALVNMNGELIGINSAILSKTGSYAGYGFAIPIDIVKKIVEDIIDYGEVQKAFFGAEVVEINENIANQLELKDRSGVVVSYVQSGGAAEKAGMEKGDIIIGIDGQQVDSHSAFSEIIGYHYPGDKLTIKYNRGSESFTKNLTLTNREGTTELLKREIYVSESLGAEFESVSKVERDMLKIPGGIKLVSVRTGLIKKLGIEEGFIITAINQKVLKDAKELENILAKIKGKVVIEGVNSKGIRGYYSYYF